MKKQEFIDRSVLAIVSRSSVCSENEAKNVWRLAEMLWEARPIRPNPDDRIIVESSGIKDKYWQTFWNNYDKKVGTSKAKDKFMAIPIDQMRNVCENALTYARSTPEVQYRKHPITWLNQKCWLDSLPKDGTKQSNLGLV